jgi:hypothetical protein
MIMKRLARIKYVFLFIVLFGAIVSCERDIENLGVDLLDNNKFGIGDTLFNVVSYTIKVDSSRVDNNKFTAQPGYLLGVNRNSNFGQMTSSFATQLLLPTEGVNFGDNAIIDMVVLNIPYYSTKDTVQYAKDPVTGELILNKEGKPIVTPSFELDSIYGNQDLEYQLKISELTTFLNTLDPNDPTKSKTYYSNRTYNTGSQLFSGNFKPNRNDTVLYVKRVHLDGNVNTVDDIDTVKTESANPSMKFILDSQFFKTHFIDQQDSPFFQNFNSFVRYFRGIYIEPMGSDGSLMNFPAAGGSLYIYFTFEETKDEPADKDLNYNGIKGETGVLVKTKAVSQFNFGGVRVGSYSRDYGGTPAGIAIANPNKIEGEARLYVQGAAGSNAVIELFTPEVLESIRSNNWLINEVNLTFYIDQSMQSGKLPDQLYLYKYPENSIISDLRSDGFQVFDGELQYDKDGEPEKYKFRITKYVTKLIDDDNITEAKLALKVYHNTDDPFTSLDTVVTDYSWLPKGVVLHGNRSVSQEKRIKVEIYYSK